MSHLETPLLAFVPARSAAITLPETPCWKLDSGRPLEAAESADNMKKRIKLLLVDDLPVVRMGLRSCLGEHAHVKVVGEAADGREAVRKAKEVAPDVVV